MAINDRQQRLISVYKHIYQYRDMLKGSPELSFDIDSMNENDLTTAFDQINAQTTAVIAYLLGIHSTSLSVEKMLESLNRHYKKDDYWRNLLLDYIEIRQEEDEEKIATEGQTIKAEGLSLYEKLRDFQRRRKEIIDSFASKLAREKFPVNAERLFKNYLNMADLDAEEAWKVLTTNPAFFSPIITEDENGNRILSVADAKEINKKMGNFIKKMKA